jgi:CRP-like cAMP-binding protein
MNTQTAFQPTHGQSIDGPSDFTSEAGSHRATSLDSLAVITRYRRGQEICGHSNPCDTWYCVISGVAGRYVVRPDGRRQILDLLLPGDFFGFALRDAYDSNVDAASDETLVASYPRRRVEALSETDPGVARQIRQAAFKVLLRQQAQLLILGRVTALQKVGNFLLDIARRTAGSGMDTLELPVSRYDIADYLAISPETVSRALTNLAQRGAIKFLGRRSVRLVDRQALED